MRALRCVDHDLGGIGVEPVNGGVRVGTGESFDDACELAKVACSAIRLEILAELAQQPQHVSALADRLDLDRRNVSVHLKVLSEAGLVCAESSGRLRRYGLTSLACVVEDGDARTWTLNGVNDTAVSISSPR